MFNYATIVYCFSNKNTKAQINPSDQITSIDIYEDFNSPTLYAEISFDDRIGLINDFPIIGEELFEITFQTPGLSYPTTYKFNTFAVSDVQQQMNGKGYTYTLKCVSKEQLTQSNINISHSYNETINDIVDNIFNTFLKTEKIVNIDPCKGNETIVFPKVTPFVAIDIIRKRAVHPKYLSSSFVFFENQDGFNFKCIEQMMEDGKEKIGSKKFYYFSNGQKDKNTEALMFRSIIEYENIGRTDLTDLIQKFNSGLITTGCTGFSGVTHKLKMVNTSTFDKELINDVDSDMVILTYLDNEALDKSIVREIEKAKEKAKTSKYWQNWFQVYGLGQVGTLQGTVFENWSIAPNIPKDAELIAYSLDWGYSNDPTALVACYKSGQQYYFDELIYQTKLTNSDIIDKLIKLGVSEYSDIIADSAEPKSIEDLRRRGFSVSPAKKGPDSIRASISLLQEIHFKVTENSTNLIKELRNYCWDVDRDGNKMQNPVDDNNHAIDAIRYLALNKLSSLSDWMDFE